MTPLDTYKKGIRERLDFNFGVPSEHGIIVTIDKKEIKNIVELYDFMNTTHKHSTLALLRALREEEDILTAIDTLISNIEKHD